MGKPFIGYRQRTWNLADGRPSHTETGYWRCPGPGRVELVLAHPTGVVEVSEGAVDRTTVTLASTALAATATAKEVTALTRHLDVRGDALEYTLDMAAVGQGLALHLHASLRRVGPGGSS